MNKIALTKIDEKEFDSLTFESNTIVLVFFGVKRCKVCIEQLPIIEQIAYEYKDNIKAYWVDVDKCKPLFYRFRLQGVPNILIFNEGEVKEKIRGLNSKETFIELINNMMIKND